MSSSISAAARAVRSEPAESLKIVIVEHVAAAGMLAQILTRNYGVPKNKITQLGYTASDDQNAALLRKGNSIAIVARPILVNRPCEFVPPTNAREAVIIDATGAELKIERRPCGPGPFELTN